MAKVLCIDSEPSTVGIIQSAGHNVVAGEIGYRTGRPNFSVPPHEVDAIVCDLKQPACYDSLDWGPGRSNDNYRCKIVKEIPVFAQLFNGTNKPRYRIIEETQLKQRSKSFVFPAGNFGSSDLLRAVAFAGIPIFFFLNPEWMRHVSGESPNFFGVRWRFNQTTATDISFAKLFEELISKFGNPIKFRMPIQFEISHVPRFVDAEPTSPNLPFVQWLSLLTNKVGQVFGQFLQLGKGYVWLLPALENNAAFVVEALKMLQEFKAPSVSAAFEKLHSPSAISPMKNDTTIDSFLASLAPTNFPTLEKTSVLAPTATTRQLEDFDEFKFVEKIPRTTLPKEVLKNVRNLYEKNEIENFVREIIGDSTKTPHGPTEIADIVTRLTCRSKKYEAAFVIKGKSCQKVTAKKISHQIDKLDRLSRLNVIILLAVGQIQDDAVEIFRKQAEKMHVDDLIIKAEDVARLFIAYKKICPKGGTSFVQGRCPKCGDLREFA